MMIWGALGILLVLASGVIYIDQNAVARAEGQVLIKAIQNQKENELIVRKVSAEKREKMEVRNQRLQAVLDNLPPPVEPLGEFCRPGCRLKWSKD